jgi:hypothetical protein
MSISYGDLSGGICANSANVACAAGGSSVKKINIF